MLYYDNDHKQQALSFPTKKILQLEETRNTKMLLVLIAAHLLKIDTSNVEFFITKMVHDKGGKKKIQHQH